MRLKEGNKEIDILNAAIAVFAESGFHNAKIAKIAETANVAAGSVYVYFKNKEDLLLKIFDQLWEKLYNELYAMVERKELSPVDKFDFMIDVLFDNLTSNAALSAVFVNEQNQAIQRNPERFTPNYEKFMQLGEKIVREGIKSNHFNSKYDVKVLRAFIFGGLRHLLHIWAGNTDSSLSLNKIRKNVKDLVKNGLMK